MNAKKTNEQKIEELKKKASAILKQAQLIEQKEKTKQRKAQNHAKFVLAGLILKVWKGKPEELDKIIKYCTSDKDKEALATLKSLL